MSVLSRDILKSSVTRGSLRMWWLGQAGFAFKTAAGKIIFVDPYLSDAVERLHGFKRLSLAPIAADEVRADLVILTHEHTDHLDPDALPQIARRNPACRFAGPIGCVEGLRSAEVAPQRQCVLDPQQVHDLGGVVVHAVAADHGDESASALSLVLDFDGIKVFVTGDTALRLGRFRPLLSLEPDVVLPCINGVFGNMNHIDAARLVQHAKPRFAIPCHYWTFAEQGGADPAGFLHACRKFYPDVEALLLKPGEGFNVHKRPPLGVTVHGRHRLMTPAHSTRRKTRCVKKP